MKGELFCPLCGFAGELAPDLLRCPACGAPLRFRGELPGIEPGDLRGRGVWRYGPLLPRVEPVSLGEGSTPLIPSRRLGPELGLDLLFKLESTNPTGSFKDRGATVMVSVLREAGVGAVADDSSGNAAAALAAYAARAGMRAVLFVPSYASGPKLSQIRAYGAELRSVPGPRGKAQEEVSRACRDEGLTYASHNESPFYIEGLKTVAFEIFEDLGLDLPDYVVLPLGGGGLFLGLAEGFRELMELGWSDSLPAFGIVQSDACAPIVVALERGLPEPVLVEPARSVAEGVLVAAPPRGREILRELRALQGLGTAVGDEEVLVAQRSLAREEGLYVEPTSALALAGLRAFVSQGKIPPRSRVVLVLTGSGLKAG